MTALEQCNGNLDDAALWLTQNANAVNQFSNFLQFVTEDDQADESGGFGILNKGSILTFQQLEVSDIVGMKFQ